MFDFVRPGSREMVARSFTKTAKWSLEVSRIVEWRARKLREMRANGRSEFRIPWQKVASNFTESELA
jgi:hypothetical protein